MAHGEQLRSVGDRFGPSKAQLEADSGLSGDGPGRQTDAIIELRPDDIVWAVDDDDIVGEANVDEHERSDLETTREEPDLWEVVAAAMEEAADEIVRDDSGDGRTVRIKLPRPASAGGVDTKRGSKPADGDSLGIELPRPPKPPASKSSGAKKDSRIELPRPSALSSKKTQKSAKKSRERAISDRWVEIREDGEVRFTATVNDDGTLEVPAPLLHKKLFQPGDVLYLKTELPVAK